MMNLALRSRLSSSPRKHLYIGITYILLLQVLDWTTTIIAMNLPYKEGMWLVESNPITAAWMQIGTHVWLGGCFAVTLFIVGVVTVYWRYLEKKRPEHLQYYLFLISLAVSPSLAAVVNNTRLLIQWWML